MVREVPREVPMQVPEDLAKEAVRETESEESATRYVLDRTYLNLEWGDVEPPD